MTPMSNLEAELDKHKKEEEAEKLSEEVHALTEHVHQQTSKACSLLASKGKISLPTVANVTSEIELNMQHVSSVTMLYNPNKQLEGIRMQICNSLQLFLVTSTKHCLHQSLKCCGEKVAYMEKWQKP